MLTPRITTVPENVPNAPTDPDPADQQDKIPPKLDYTTIDFETVNSYRGSPCAVGLVRVLDGIAADGLHWLIRPPEPVDLVDNFNIALHGITPEMVATAPR